MGSTFTSLHLHIVFSTKERRSFIAPRWRSELHKYLGGTVRGLDGVPTAVGGVEDHVHLLVGMKPIHCLANFVRELKKASSVWAAENHEPKFSWQAGYSAFSISATHCAAVSRYIVTQEEHHRQTSFFDELKQLLEKNGVAYDPQYLA